MGLRGILRTALTSKNIIATVAAVVSITGTSFAAKMYGARAFKANTIQYVDIGKRQLFYDKFSQSTVDYLHSRKGIKGDKGVTGNQGTQGFKGSTGDEGDPAPRAFTYLRADDQHNAVSNATLNPPTLTDCQVATPANSGDTCTTTWYPSWSWYCAGVGSRYCNRGFSNWCVSKYVPTSWVEVMSYTSPCASNGGYLTLDRPGNIVVTGSITLLHSAAYANDNHTRAECKIQSRLTGGDNWVDMGTPTVVSSDLDHQLVHVTVTGGHRYEDPGVYDFRITCHQLDDYSSGITANDWIFVKGQANAISTEDE